MGRVFFVMINNRIMVTEEAENKRQAKRNVRARLAEIPTVYLHVEALAPGSTEAEEAVQHCEVISQAELGLIVDSYVSARVNAAIARKELREAQAKLRQARHELREAMDRAKDHEDWLAKKERELGLPEAVIAYDMLDEDEDEDDY